MLSANIGRPPANFVFDPIKTSDPLQQVGGQRRRAGLVVLEYLAPKMRPAGHLLDSAPNIELLVTSVAVCLGETGKTLQLGLRMDAAAVG